MARDTVGRGLDWIIDMMVIIVVGTIAWGWTQSDIIAGAIMISGSIIALKTRVDMTEFLTGEKQAAPK